MQEVTPTKKWQQNILPVPVGDSLPVRLPLNHPRVISVTDKVAEYLVSNGFAVYCNYMGEPVNTAKEQQSEVEPKPEKVAPVEEDKSAPEDDKLAPVEEDKSAPEDDKLALDKSAQKAFAFIKDNSAEAIADACKAIRVEKAQKLKELFEAEAEITWEQVAEVLTERQEKALLNMMEE